MSAAEIMKRMGYRELVTGQGKWLKPIGRHVLVATGTHLSLWFRYYNNAAHDCWGREPLLLDDALTLQTALTVECHVLPGFDALRGSQTFDGFCFLNNEQLAEILIES